MSFSDICDLIDTLEKGIGNGARVTLGKQSGIHSVVIRVDWYPDDWHIRYVVPENVDNDVDNDVDAFIRYFVDFAKFGYSKRMKG